MNEDAAGRKMNKIRSILSVIGPGVFAIGYTIGTGSITSMAKAGAMIPRTQVSIGHMLENRQYLGTDFYPPIVDQKLFERVQDARAARYVPGRQGGSKRRREAQPIFNSFRFAKRPKLTTGGVEALGQVYGLLEIAEESTRVVPDIQITVMTRSTNITSNAG